MVGIVCFWDRTATPYLQKYENILTSINKPYEIIFWSRTSEIVSERENEIDITLKCRNNPLMKALDFFRWRGRVLRLLRKKKYEKLIVLTTVPAVLLGGYLKRHYRDNYIFDIRDYTAETNPIFGYLVNRLVEYSSLTAISSDAYRRWLLQSEKIIVNHNITWTEETTEDKKFFSGDCFNFVFAGNIRAENQTLMAVKALKNNPKIRIGFIGRILPSCLIREFCRDEGIANVYFGEQFKNEEKPAIYRNIDLINCVYANEPQGEVDIGVVTQIPNRLYDSVIFHVPIVCCKGTYLEEIVDKYHLGFAIDAFTDDIPACFERYIDTFDKEAFISGCKEFLTLCRQEEETFKSQVLLFLQGE